MSIQILRLNIKIVNNDNSVEQRAYDLWKNTGGLGFNTNVVPPPETIFLLDNNDDFILDETDQQITLRQ